MRYRFLLLLSLTILAACLSCRTTWGQATEPEEEKSWGLGRSDIEMFNLPLPTLGGKQFWTDFRWRYGWRLQQNALTKHWRLLDPQNVRRAWGNQEECAKSLDELVPMESQLPPRRVAILLHGLMRTSQSMKPIALQLEQNGNSVPIALEYASTRASIGEHAQALRALIESLPGSPQIDLVAHSMGNIVARHAIHDWQQPGNDPKRVLPRLHRMAMLGPPNQGANIARSLAKTGIFGAVTGQGGLELGPQWESLQPKLATPPFPFLIVAGKLENSSLKNPLVEGDGDFVVGVEEAKLDGAEDFVEVPVLHSFLMDDVTVQQKVIDFLNRP